MFDLNELKLIRVSLDAVTIKGSDAKYLANLQLKTESIIEEISNPPKQSTKK